MISERESRRVHHSREWLWQWALGTSWQPSPRRREETDRTCPRQQWARPEEACDSSEPVGGRFATTLQSARRTSPSRAQHTPQRRYRTSPVQRYRSGVCEHGVWGRSCGRRPRSPEQAPLRTAGAEERTGGGTPRLRHLHRRLANPLPQQHRQVLRRPHRPPRLRRDGPTALVLRGM